MANTYTVKQVNAYVKNMFTQDFMLNRIYVKGEVSNCKHHTSGHIYFSLKDESGTIACVMFAGQRKGLAFHLMDGQEVVTLGSISIYERDGKYQLYAKEIILDGAGILHQKFEALKQELLDMGMFSTDYKRPIPAFVKTIGIVTASTGAAIRDITSIAARRNPYIQLILYPALVQGEGAVASIVKGIQLLEKQKVDVIIVGRGGGSIEDLQAFNEEAVARAIFDCKIPIVSAVGHETDVTIADYVADLRAATPSAAAELTVYEYLAVEEQRKTYALRLQKQMRQHIKADKGRLQEVSLRIKYLHPRRKLQEKQQSLVDLEETLRKMMTQKLVDKRHSLEVYIHQMKGLSPLTKLSQGFSYVTDSSGKTIKEVDHVHIKDQMDIYVVDGVIRAEVLSTKKESYHDKG